VRAELAAADALADAPDAAGGSSAVLEILCAQLDWAGAWLWAAGPGSPRPLAHHGTAQFKHSTLAALAAETMVTGQSTWSAEHAALALPIGDSGNVRGAIVLIDRTTDGPEQPRVAVTRSIVARLAKFLARVKS
jgi:hypothetical protein